MAAAAAAAEAEALARFQGGADARRAGDPGGPHGDGPAPGARRFPGQAEDDGRRSRAPGHRHAGGVRRVRAAPARGDVGPAERRRLRPDVELTRELAPDDESYYARARRA